jgi:hypothetical protein
LAVATPDETPVTETLSILPYCKFPNNVVNPTMVFRVSEPGEAIDTVAV